MTANDTSRRRPGRQGRRARVPRYRRIADELIAEIRDGRWRVGDTLPGDIELTRRFGVGRHTVRAALHQLEELGLIRRRPRVGTVLQATRPTASYTHSVQSPDGLLQYPAGSRLRVVDSGPVRAGRGLAGALRLPSGSRWHRLSGPRESPEGGPPLCWVDVYLLPELAGVEAVLAHDGRRVFEHIEQMYDRRVARVTINLQAGTIDASLAEPLQVEPDAAALAITRRFYDDAGILIEVSQSRHPAGRFAYELELVRDWIRPDPPARER